MLIFYWKYYLIFFFKTILMLGLRRRHQNKLTLKTSFKQLEVVVSSKNFHTKFVTNDLTQVTSSIAVQNATALKNLVSNLTSKQHLIYFTGCSDLIPDFFNFYSLFFSTSKLLKYSWLLRLNLLTSSTVWISFCLKQLKQLNFLIIFSLTDAVKIKKLNVVALKNDYLLIGLTTKLFNSNYILNLYVTALTFFQKYLYFWVTWALVLNFIKYRNAVRSPFQLVVNIQQSL